MLSRQKKIYLAITVIVLAVILILAGLLKLFFVSRQKSVDSQPLTTNATSTQNALRHPLNGQVVSNENWSYFPVAVMIDNSYTVRPQAGLAQADIIYEALAESNITRLLAIFDKNNVAEKVGPVRSARSYYMDWAQEYGGIYMHVGGSPQALADIKKYNFTNIDQIGAGEIYFWRDQKLKMPSNVFTSATNWLRAGEIKEVESSNASSSINILWHYVDTPAPDETQKPEITIKYSEDYYKANWRFNNALQQYQRWQDDEKFSFDTGDQAAVSNVIVQVVDAQLIDIERRSMDTQKGGKVYIFNALGQQSGQWKYINNRTRFFNEQGTEQLKLLSGHTWVQIINDENILEIK
jgi:hypothetical protein